MPISEIPGIIRETRRTVRDFERGDTGWATDLIQENQTESRRASVALARAETRLQRAQNDLRLEGRVAARQSEVAVARARLMEIPTPKKLLDNSIRDRVEGALDRIGQEFIPYRTSGVMSSFGIRAGIDLLEQKVRTLDMEQLALGDPAPLPWLFQYFKEISPLAYNLAYIIQGLETGSLSQMVWHENPDGSRQGLVHRDLDLRGQEISVGPGALVFDRALLDPRTTIGAGCWVGANAVAKNVNLKESVHVGPHAFLQNCTVEPGVWIGQSAHVNGGGIHQVVPQGHWVPENSWFGHRANYIEQGRIF